MPYPRTGPRRRALAVALAAAALAGFTGLATAPASAAPTATGTSRTLNITMQQQQKSNWCWAATGDTIAAYLGHSYTQNTFCDAAFGYSSGSTCPNNQAALNNVQNAFSSFGIRPGRYVTGYLLYSTVQTEINADRPIATRIQWSSGGGHMEVIYGYDTSDNWVYWGDPWPSDYRYNWADYGYYVSNSSFSWTHSLYQIGA